MASEPTPAPPLDRVLMDRKLAYLTSEVRQFPRTQPVASDLDPDGCLRRQVLEVVAWKDKPLPDAEAEERFRAGREAERRGVALLGEMGVDVVRQQESFELRHRRTDRKVLGGKIDGVLPAWRVVLEIKLVMPWAFDRIETAEDLGRFWWMSRYQNQAQAYMIGLSLEGCLFMLTDGRRWKWLPVYALDLDIAERSWAYAEKIADAIELYRTTERSGGKSLPDYTTDQAQCRRCPFFGRTCQPPVSEAGAEYITNDEDVAALNRWHELKPAHREYEALDKYINARLKPGNPLKIVGDYLVEVKLVPVKAEAVARPARVDKHLKITPLGAAGLAEE